MPFRTKPQLALEIPTELTAEGTLPMRWVTCDEGFGRSRVFLDSVVNPLSLATGGIHGGFDVYRPYVLLPVV